MQRNHSRTAGDEAFLSSVLMESPEHLPQTDASVEFPQRLAHTPNQIECRQVLVLRP